MGVWANDAVLCYHCLFLLAVWVPVNNAGTGTTGGIVSVIFSALRAVLAMELGRLWGNEERGNI